MIAMENQKNDRSGKAFLRRLFLSSVQMILLWLFATALLYVILALLPGDAASTQAGRIGEKAALELRHTLGLDQPLLSRYLHWLVAVLQGDFGTTFFTQKAVTEVIDTPFLASLVVSLLVFLGLIFVTIPGAVFAGYYNNKGTRLTSRLVVLLSSIPEFILAILLLILFALQMKILPVLSTPGPGESVLSQPLCLIMPSLCLWTICSLSLFRYVRVMVEQHAEMAYVREAHLSGLSRRRVLFIHLLPSIRGGLYQMMASTIPYLLGGSIVTETITSFPGMGYTLISAINQRETPIVMAIGSLLILLSILSFFIADRVSTERC